MTSSTPSSSMSALNSQSNCLDPLDSLIDFSEYEQLSYQSPSPTIGQKQQFTTRPVSNTPATLPASQPTLNGPSHNYDLYRQQTGIPQGAIASTLAVNSSNIHISPYAFNESYLSSGISPNDEFVDFGSAPTFKDTDMDFESPNAEPAFFYPEATNDFVDPSAIGSSAPPPSTTTSNVGRLWPGMHQQQAALAKAQAQQKQQQEIIRQQRQAAMGGSRAGSQQRPKASHPPTDPIVEEKISQLLNSMRHSSVSTDDNDAKTPGVSHSRSRKDEEEMDEDERLLASEEGKKLSSKERRQLRNKVSARAFRSRRKEYIGQLEGEIAIKVNENQDLRSQNRALLEENTRLSDLTRMLLSSPSFSGFLDTLSTNPAAAQTAQAVTQSQPTQTEQPRQQKRKDVNPYAAQQHMQNQQIGMTMIPEQTMDFSMLDLGNDSFYQPQVFSVLSIPETVIDTEALSGKSASPSFTRQDEKVELPTVERMPASNPEKEVKTQTVAPAVDEEFDSDPSFSLFTAEDKDNTTTKPQELDINALITSINVSKPTQYELITSTSPSEDDTAMRRVERMFKGLESVVERLNVLVVDL